MKVLRTICTVLFGAAVLLFFGLAYPHHLHYQEQFQLFLFDCAYVWDIVKLPGGVADLLGRFCTQFFLYAWVGALIIAVLLMAVQLLTLRLINSKTGQGAKVSGGLLYGLSFVPSFLLWLFLLDENALLGGVWAVLLTLLAAWLFDALPRNWLWRVLIFVAIPVLYWMVGPVCLLFFLLQAVSVEKWITRTVPVNQGTVHVTRVSVILLLLMPVILAYYLPVPSSNLCFGIHYHRYPTAIPIVLWLAVLAVFILVLIARAWNHGDRQNHGDRLPDSGQNQKPVPKIPSSYLLPLASFVVVAAVMGSIVWKNSNFKAEKVMKYDFMARYQQWNRILETINTDRPNNQIGVTVQNLALGMRGLLTQHLFDYNQNGLLGLLPDIGTDATSPMPTAEAFYQLGMITVAQRTVFEAQEAILDFQKSGRCYKRLAQTNLILGHYEVARKYLTALKKTLFYRDWANETLPLLGDEKAIAKHPEYGRLRQMAYKENFFFGDHVTSDMLQRLFLSNTDNHLAYEYLKAYYMLTGDRENYTKLQLQYPEQ